VNVVLGLIKLVAEEGRQITVPAANFERIDNRWKIRNLEADGTVK
jgi:hypothetical protein